MKKRIKFLMGADPEFVVKGKNNQIICADSLPLYSDNEFGADGGGVAFELRPRPAYTPEKLVLNIKEAMQGGSLKEIVDAKWQAGSCHRMYNDYQDEVPIGGHIHFGTKGIISPKKLIDFLDIYLGIPVSMITNKTGRKKEEKIDWSLDMENMGIIDYKNGA